MSHDRINGAETDRSNRPGTFRPGNPGRPFGAVRLQLPLRTLADLDVASDVVSGALADGTVVLDEVAVLTGLIEARRRLLETTELERRLANLERAAPR